MHTTPLLAAVILAGSAAAQVSLRDVSQLARARAERLRPKQVAALQPFWGDLALEYRNNSQFLNQRIEKASQLGDSVVPMLLEKLKPAQSGSEARNLASNCRRVLQRLDPSSFVDALVELARGDHAIARSQAIRLLGYTSARQAAPVLTSLIDQVEGEDRLQAVRSLRLLRARSVAPKIVKLLGTKDTKLREEVLAYLSAARAASVSATVVQALEAESSDRLLPAFIDYFRTSVSTDPVATAALLPLLGRDRIDWQDTRNLVEALSRVAPKRHEPTIRALHELIDGNETSSLAVQAAVSLRALGDKQGITDLKRALDGKVRRNKRKASPYEQRARLRFAIGDFSNAVDDYEKLLEFSEGAAMTRRAYVGILKAEARRERIQSLVKNMKSSGMTPDELVELAADDEPIGKCMGHERVQNFLKKLRKDRAPK
ncbi:MAG: HEAT repeat domain-containing protein [Planctomycetota bacterium]